MTNVHFDGSSSLNFVIEYIAKYAFSGIRVFKRSSFVSYW